MKYITYIWDKIYGQNNYYIYNYVLIPNDIDIQEDLKNLNLQYHIILDFYQEIKFKKM
jgi:hypothetical protein